MPTAASAPNLDVNSGLTDDWRAFCRLPDILLNLSRLNVATLFVFGDHDIRPSWPTRQLSRLMPNAAFIPLTAADHMLWVGNPSGLQKILWDFLAATAANQGSHPHIRGK